MNSHAKLRRRILPVAFSLALLLACSVAQAVDYIVKPGQSIQAVVDGAATGDTVTLADGLHKGPVDFKSKSGVTLRAASAGKAIVQGGRIVGGSVIVLDGFVFENGSSNYQVGAIQVGAGSKLVNLTVRRCDSLGVLLNSDSILENSVVVDNGYLGVANWPNAACKNVTIRGNVVARNNRGWDTKPPWASYRHPIMTSDLGFTRQVDASGNIVASGGTAKWFANPAWEAGGIKCAWIVAGLVIENNVAFDNGGCGIWLDCYVRNAVVRGNEMYGQRGISASWEGPGAWDEINDGPNLWENNYIHDNASGMLLMETAGATVRNNIFKNNGIGFRDIAGRTPGLKNITITNNKVYGTQGINAAPAGRNITQSGNQTGLTGTPTWVRPGVVVVPPVTPPVTPPASLVESVDNTRITPGSGSIVNAALKAWALRVDGKLYLDGVWDGQSGGVTEAVYRNHKLYQLGHGVWYVRDGAGWKAENPPAVVIPPVADLKDKQIADLTAALTAARAERDTALAKIVELTAQAGVSKAELDGAKAALVAAEGRLAQIAAIAKS